MGKSTYAIGGHNKHKCAYNGGRGSTFCHSGAYLIFESTLLKKILMHGNKTIWHEEKGEIIWETL